MIRKGMRVFFKPEFQDAGDETVTFIALEDESAGDTSLDVLYDLPKFAIKPHQIVPIQTIDRERTEAFNA